MNPLHFLFPERCPACDRVLPLAEYGFCEECFKDIRLIRGPVCIKCGRPVERDRTFCSDCSATSHEFISGRFSFSYEDISDSVYRFKYDKRPEYAKAYAKVLTHELSGFIDMVSPDALIPVPIHKRRLLKRGYNQAELLCNELSRLTGIPVRNDIVFRAVNTKPQKKYDRVHRQINVKKAFTHTENVVKLGNVILIDDIYTTGSTIDSVAAELKKAGIKNIYFMTITAAGT